jgi:hypothetical protein
MDNKQKLQLMDKVIRELDDLKNSQTSVLKKLSQVEADNITLGESLLDEELPEIHEKINESVEMINGLSEKFNEVRSQFYTDNNLAASEDATA